MSLRLKILIFAVVFALGQSASSGQSDLLRQAMREKLTNTQGLLEAVVRADYPAIERSTEPLSRISEVEIASWQAWRNRTTSGRRRSSSSRSRGLREAASNRNIEAVTLEYTTLVSSCIRCHTYVRGSQIASGEARKPFDAP